MINSLRIHYIMDVQDKFFKKKKKNWKGKKKKNTHRNRFSQITG